jgi:hypothetical protein
MYHCCASDGNGTVQQVAAGADIEAKDNYGDTPFS